MNIVLDDRVNLVENGFLHVKVLMLILQVLSMGQ